MALRVHGTQKASFMGGNGSWNRALPTGVHTLVRCRVAIDIFLIEIGTCWWQQLCQQQSSFQYEGKIPQDRGTGDAVCRIRLRGGRCVAGKLWPVLRPNTF